MVNLLACSLLTDRPTAKPEAQAIKEDAALSNLGDF